MVYEGVILNQKIVYIARFIPHYHVPLWKELEKKFQKNGDTFSLVSVKTPPKEGRTGVDGKIIKNHYFYEKDKEQYIGSFCLYWQKGVLDILKEIKPDKIIMPGHVGNATSWIICKKYDKVFTWQCGYEYHSSRIKDFLQKKYLNGFTHHLAYHTYAKKFTMNYNIPEEKITVIHNTIDQSQLKTASIEESRLFLKDTYAIPMDTNVLLYVGTILAEKNLDILISMMNFLDDSFQLIIVGDGPYKKELEKTLNKNVTFTGNQLIDKHHFFIAADIFFMPGTGGLALNEAMFYGNVLFSALGDGSAEDLVIEDFNGKRIDKLDGKLLAESVKDIYKSDKINAYKKNAQSLKDKFSFNDFTETIINTVNRI